MRTPPEDRPTLRIPLLRILLAPVALFAGSLLGFLIGAWYLPYLLLGELSRKIGQSWPWLDGWAEWAESGGKAREPRRGWWLLWIVWTLLFFGSMFTWAPWVGIFLGAFIGVGLVFAPDGWDRLMKGARVLRDRFRRLRITIREFEGSPPVGSPMGRGKRTLPGIPR